MAKNNKTKDTNHTEFAEEHNASPDKEKNQKSK